MSYPSVAVKSAAVKLLQALQKSAIDTRKMWNQPWFAGLDYKGDLSWGEQHLSVVVCRLVQAMWLEVSLSYCTHNFLVFLYLLSKSALVSLIFLPISGYATLYSSNSRDDSLDLSC